MTMALREILERLPRMTTRIQRADKSPTVDGVAFTCSLVCKPITVTRAELDEARRAGPLGLWERLWLDTIDAARRHR